MSIVKNIVRSVSAKDKLNILVAPLDGMFEDMLSETGHDIYALPMLSKYGFVGTKCKVLENPNHLPINLTFDAIICNDRVVQFDTCRNISNVLHIPLVVVEHYNPVNMLRLDDLNVISANQKVKNYVYVDESIHNYWHDNGKLIHYGVTKQQPVEKQDVILACGHFNQLEHMSVANMLAEIGPNVVINLNTERVSAEQLHAMCATASVFVCFNAHNNINIPMIYGMANGCAIVSSRLPILEKLLDKQNSLLCNGLQEFVGALKFLKTSNDLIHNLGNAARSVAEQRFCMNTFISSWNMVLNETVNNGYV